MMPGISGIELIKLLKQKTDTIEFVIITGYASVDTAIEAVRIGAFDYIVKPFNPSEMMARLKAHLEIHQRLLGGRFQDADDNKPDIQVGDLRIFIKRHQVFRGKTEINLTGKEFNLLLFLARHPNQVFSKKYLFEMIWHLDALGELARQHALHLDEPRELAGLTHTFSHFQLAIEPWLVRVEQAGGAVAEGDWLWYNLATPPRLGLAAPVKKLLKRAAQELNAGEAS